MHFQLYVVFFGIDNPVHHLLDPKMPLTYVVYICDISLTKGHLGSSWGGGELGGGISKHKLKYTELSVLMTYITFPCKSLGHAQ